jgi:hypothetical protein
MSRWFRHYAGMMRDEKLVAVAVKSKQPIDRVAWVWLAILESAAEIDDGGVFLVPWDASAYWLHVEEADLLLAVTALEDENLVRGDMVTDWHNFSRHCTRLPWSEWALIRLGVFQRDDFTCRYCKAHGVQLECDHVVPLSRGGTNDRSNLVTSCRDCNRMKADKSLDELGWEL